jgi:excinuclease ABC subunit A
VPGNLARGHRRARARHDNLGDVDGDVPLWRTVAVAEVSGSGKRSLAIGTLTAGDLDGY